MVLKAIRVVLGHSVVTENCHLVPLSRTWTQVLQDAVPAHWPPFHCLPSHAFMYTPLPKPQFSSFQFSFISPFHTPHNPPRVSSSHSRLSLIVHWHHRMGYENISIHQCREEGIYDKHTVSWYILRFVTLGHTRSKCVAHMWSLVKKLNVLWWVVGQWWDAI